MRRLVVNADDLGLTRGVNDGIFDAHHHGILTSASLFANAPATLDAVARARSVSLGVGVHLTLVDGAPVLPPASIPTLIEGDGRFRRSWKPFIVACLTGRVSLVEVERELIAQVERLLAAGIRPTHVDTHKHVHMYPPVFATVATVAARYGISVVRVAYEPDWATEFRRARGLSGGTVRRQALLTAATGLWARHNRRVARSLGLVTPRFIGRIQTGVLDRSMLQALLRGIGDGVTELMVHPGYANAALAATGTRLLASRERELELLCDLATRAVVDTENIILTRHDLKPVDRRSLRHVS